MLKGKNRHAKARHNKSGGEKTLQINIEEEEREYAEEEAKAREEVEKQKAAASATAASAPVVPVAASPPATTTPAPAQQQMAMEDTESTTCSSDTEDEITTPESKRKSVRKRSLDSVHSEPSTNKDSASDDKKESELSDGETNDLDEDSLADSSEIETKSASQTSPQHSQRQLQTSPEKTAGAGDAAQTSPKPRMRVAPLNLSFRMTSASAETAVDSKQQASSGEQAATGEKDKGKEKEAVYSALASVKASHQSSSMMAQSMDDLLLDSTKKDTSPSSTAATTANRSSSKQEDRHRYYNHYPTAILGLILDALDKWCAEEAGPSSEIVPPVIPLGLLSPDRDRLDRGGSGGEGDGFGEEDKSTAPLSLVDLLFDHQSDISASESASSMVDEPGKDEERGKREEDIELLFHLYRHACHLPINQSNLNIIKKCATLFRHLFWVLLTTTT